MWTRPQHVTSATLFLRNCLKLRSWWLTLLEFTVVFVHHHHRGVRIKLAEPFEPEGCWFKPSVTCWVTGTKQWTLFFFPLFKPFFWIWSQFLLLLTSCLVEDTEEEARTGCSAAAVRIFSPHCSSVLPHSLHLTSQPILFSYDAFLLLLLLFGALINVACCCWRRPIFIRRITRWLHTRLTPSQ